MPVPTTGDNVLANYVHNASQKGYRRFRIAYALLRSTISTKPWKRLQRYCCLNNCSTRSQS